MSSSQISFFNNTITPPKQAQDTGGICFIYVKDKKNKISESINHMAQSAFLSKHVITEPTNTSEIPQFYFPKGKPVDNVTKTSTRSQINAIVG
jgi:hypothetical protein